MRPPDGSAGPSCSHWPMVVDQNGCNIETLTLNHEATAHMSQYASSYHIRTVYTALYLNSIATCHEERIVHLAGCGQTGLAPGSDGLHVLSMVDAHSPEALDKLRKQWSLCSNHLSTAKASSSSHVRKKKN